MTDPTIRRLREIERRQWALEAKERERVAKVAERQPPQQEYSRRLAAIGSEWQMFKAAANAAVQQQQQMARQRALERTIEEISLLIRGPKEPEIIVIEGEGGGGGPDLLFTEPHRWW